MEITGNISSTPGITGLTLAGSAGSKFTLSGNNTYSGTTTLGVVQLNINSATAISSGNLVTASAVIDNTSGSTKTLTNNNSILAGGTLTYGGTNDLNFGTGSFISNASTRTIITNGTGTLTFGSMDASASGVGFSKTTGTGTLAITGAAGTNLTGTISLNAGTTIIGHKSSLGTGTVSLGGGTFSASTDLSGVGNSVANAISLGSSSAFGGSNNIELSGNVTMTALRTLTNSIAGGNLTLSGATLGLGNGAAAFTLSLSGTGNTIINSVIQDNGAAGSLTITNAGGSVALNGNNTYTGTTSLSGGSVTVGHKAAFGTSALNWAASATTLSASTDLSGANKITNSVSLLSNSAPTFSGSNNIELGGNFTQTASKIVTNNIASGKALTFSTGVVNLSNIASNFIMTFAGSGDTVVNSVIQNGGTSTAGGVTINTTGSVTMAGTNTYGGLTTVSAGTLIINGTGSINSGSSVAVSGGHFKYDSSVGLSRNATITNGAKLSYNSSANYSGTLAYTNGTLAGTNWNGNLGGLTIGANKTISPGNSVGNATTTTQTWGTGGSYVWEINKGDGTAGNVGGGWDLLTLSGALTISATSVTPFAINITSLGLDNLPGLATGFTNTSDYNWLIAQAGSAITTFSADKFILNTTGTFQNAFTGTFAVALGNTGSIGGNDTQLYLTYTAIPEPATWALLAFSLTTVVVLRRRRNS